MTRNKMLTLKWFLILEGGGIITLATPITMTACADEGPVIHDLIQMNADLLAKNFIFVNNAVLSMECSFFNKNFYDIKVSSTLQGIKGASNIWNGIAFQHDIYSPNGETMIEASGIPANIYNSTLFISLGG